MKAIWNDQIIAQSDDTKVIENNHYFPPNSIKKEFYNESSTQSNCPWKGMASYFTIEVDGAQNKDAAWYYPNTKHAAKEIEGYVAFWKGVKITK